MSVLCPVCQAPMEQAGNLNIYSCPFNKINIKLLKLNVSLDINHANVFLNDLGQQTFAKIISAEYSFEIFNSDKHCLESKTIIKALKKINRPTWNQTPGMTFNLDVAASDQFEFVELITINSAISLPWDNHDKVRDAVKTYLLFS